MPTDRLVDFPVDQYPDPICRYHIENGSIVVEAGNIAFDELVSARENAITDLLTVEDHDASVTDRVSEGSPFVGYIDSQSFLVRPVPTEHPRGFLVFVSHPNTIDCSDDVGVGHVASVLSHDLRNPLDVAKARLEAGRDTGDDTHFEHVERAHERMERIIRDVLTLARGTEVIEPNESADLERIIDDAWTHVATDEAELIVDDPLPRIRADAGRATRLFENLFRNAIEHGPVGADRSVSVTVRPLEDGPGVAVSDDGCGIPETERPHIFEPGYSVGDQGTGLGLAIVDRIADIHGWEMTVTASQAGGARFEVRGFSVIDGGD